jgi:hypothetical protein
MIDVDHNGPQATAGRLFLLGADLDAIADPERFRYYEPEDGEELLAAVTDITNRRTDVTVLDSLGEIFPMLGVKTNDGDEITTAMRQVLTRPALAGSCVITIDHLPKSTEARTSGFAIGSIAKKRMIRGAYLRADAKESQPPAAVGRITLRIEKDTTGELRRSSGGGYAGDPRPRLHRRPLPLLAHRPRHRPQERRRHPPPDHPHGARRHLRRRPTRLHPARHRRRRPGQDQVDPRSPPDPRHRRPHQPRCRAPTQLAPRPRDPLPRGGR